MKAIVTGHSRGLGASLAGALLARGIPVLGLARGGNAALEQAYPELLRPQALDLSDADAVAAWLAGDALGAYLSGAKSILLINNAGTVQPVGPLATQDPAAVARSVALNVAVPMMLSAAIGALQVPARDRRIAHISSGAGRQAYPGWSVYCATKAALDHHARAVSADRTPGLRICSIAPGVIDTDMQAEIRATDAGRFPLLERFVSMKRDGSLVSPEDCARRLTDFFLDERFGQEPVADLRDFS